MLPFSQNPGRRTRLKFTLQVPLTAAAATYFPSHTLAWLSEAMLANPGLSYNLSGPLVG